MGYDEFIGGIGAMAMGATTYSWVREHEPEWMPERPAWVFTHRQPAPWPGADLRFTAGDVAREHAAMVAAADGRDVWVVGGGDLAGQFADAGLLDEVVVAVAPVTLGGGAPLLPRRLELEVRELARNGEFACVRYAVRRPPSCPAVPSVTAGAPGGAYTPPEAGPDRAAPLHGVAGDPGGRHRDGELGSGHEGRSRPRG